METQVLEGGAEAGREMIKRIVTGSDLVFIASGLGGGSGTGICPIVAEEAKAAGALVVGIVTTPFHVERRQRMSRALEGLREFASSCRCRIGLG